MRRFVLCCAFAMALVGVVAPAGHGDAFVRASETNLPLDYQHKGAGGVSSCVGVAPTTAQCSTGDHDSFLVIRHGALGGSNYTGTIESRLSWPAAAPVASRQWRCNFVSGAFNGCAGTGLFPPPLVSFSHSCFSYGLGTTTAGGSGNWGCDISHD